MAYLPELHHCCVCGADLGADGARLSPASPLEGLLAHCRQQARNLEALVAEWEEPGPPMTPARQAMQDRDRARLARWRSWADGLAALLAGKE